MQVARRKNHRTPKWKVEFLQQRNETKERQAEYSKTKKGLQRITIFRIRTEYTLTARGYILEKRDTPKCLFCDTKITVEHVLWTCGKTEQKCSELNMIKNIWNEVRERILKLIHYLKKSDFTTEYKWQREDTEFKKKKRKKMYMKCKNYVMKDGRTTKKGQ
jgi:hypothetical protein